MGFTKLLVLPCWALDDSGSLPELLGFLWVFLFVCLLFWSSGAREVAIKMVFKYISGINFDQTKWKKNMFRSYLFKM